MSYTIPNVICIPGGVAPAAQRYAPLEAAVTGRARLFPKDLEVYREDQPPAGYAFLERPAESARRSRWSGLHVGLCAGAGLRRLLHPR